MLIIKISNIICVCGLVVLFLLVVLIIFKIDVQTTLILIIFHFNLFLLHSLFI